MYIYVIGSSAGPPPRYLHVPNLRVEVDLYKGEKYSYYIRHLYIIYAQHVLLTAASSSRLSNSMTPCAAAREPRSCLTYHIYMHTYIP